LASKVLGVVAVVVLAALIGVGSAFLRLRLLADINDIQIGPWRTSSLIGSLQASPYLRAVVAVNGILALNRHEAIYLTATSDDAGEPLSGACRYRVTGNDLPARWWSLTAYGTDRFLIPNPDHRYSATRNTVAHDAQGNFTVFVTQQRRDGDWIASGPKRFVLVLRAYKPDPVLATHNSGESLPHIFIEGCS